MSYILEALKKAQAERQLGELPTIHAPQLHDAARAATASRKPLWLVLGAGVLLAGGGLLAWRQPWQADSGTAPLAPLVAAVTPTAAPPAAPLLIVPAPMAAPAPKPEPVAPVATVAPAAVAKPAAVPVPAAAVAQPVAAADEAVPGLRDLPEPIQRQIPPVALGGYIYSKDPAERLLLIDKVLRHEAEEVAPGLVLEKLQPKSAIFSFKGYRYRVPY
ncbi:general secretion pathway protein GspB [Janthinobacterium agaricidamnosum]|uniref:General secretion pathway protein B n=1 Tax=Janthinobacterium agaricidamnosum NBRC 102515 = DSM 9628 TaxID=1349767 RepID=W0VBK7_9BURK|nr:general secretion pathway protein GspB [Janthinobacterium agaricidamnosum]CDG84748.1 general secretion pathway protein B [Janthinobacterium agaricidamnosum NBRC 102515 = DSM 9628]